LKNKEVSQKYGSGNEAVQEVKDYKLENADYFTTSLVCIKI
jgi:hypothetical protein